jgi:hypothetical protein
VSSLLVSLPSVSPNSIAKNITTLILLFPSCSSGAVLLQLPLQLCRFEGVSSYQTTRLRRFSSTPKLHIETVFTFSRTKVASYLERVTEVKTTFERPLDLSLEPLTP